MAILIDETKRVLVQGITGSLRFAINEFMQSCRVDDARSTFATKCLYRMGI